MAGCRHRGVLEKFPSDVSQERGSGHLYTQSFVSQPAGDESLAFDPDRILAGAPGLSLLDQLSGRAGYDQ